MNSDDKKAKGYADSFKQAGPYLGLGTQLAATIVIMFFIGKWLDSEFGTFPVFVLIFTFFGAFAGTYNFIKTALDLGKKKDATKD